MALPERPHSDSNLASTPPDLAATLAEVDRRLELADQNENTIERFLHRDKLLEERDELQAKIDASAPPPEVP